MSLIARVMVDGKLNADAFVATIERKTKLLFSAIVVESHPNGLKLTMQKPLGRDTFGGLGQLRDRYTLIKRLGFKVRWIVSPDRMKFDVERHDVMARDLPEGTKRRCLLNGQGCGNCDCVNTIGVAVNSPLACFVVTI